MSSVYEALTKAEKPTAPLNTNGMSSPGIDRQWKIIIVALGLFSVGVVNQLMSHVLRGQMDDSATMMTLNFSDAAATYLASKDVLQLNTTIAKYARLSRVAYVLVQDRHGKVIAHSMGTLPAGLQEGLTFNEAREINRRKVTLEGKTIYETSSPILDGQLGRAHIGIWAAAVESEIYGALFFFVWPLAFSIVTGVTMMGFVGRSVIRRLRWATGMRSGSQAITTRLYQ
jgi:sensor histidine kinase regulating citrate/malate metabolism